MTIRCQNGSQFGFVHCTSQVNQRLYIVQAHASYPECHRFESYLSHMRKPLCYIRHRGFSYAFRQVQNDTFKYIKIHGLVVKTVVRKCNNQVPVK